MRESRPERISMLTDSRRLLAMLEVLEETVQVEVAASLDHAAEAPVILCDADNPTHWQIAVNQLLEVNPYAVVIVASRRADERMWAEVLSAGAYDLLPWPCAAKEARCVLLGALARAAHVASAYLAASSSPVAQAIRQETRCSL